MQKIEVTGVLLVEDWVDQTHLLDQALIVMGDDANGLWPDSMFVVRTVREA